MIELMLPPFVACMLLVAIHGYFGLHVVARGVIFVDLALAQMAALGATVGLLFHVMHNDVTSQLFAIAAIACGAAVLAWTRTKERGRVPQEAIIGVVYVVASAAAILIAEKAPRGEDMIKDMLVGSLLWVTWPTILKDAIAYGLLGLFLFIFHRRFEVISFEPAVAASKGWRVRWWDFWFYLAFGVTVTFSVPIAGVLLVFSFLVVPALTAVLFARTPIRMMPIAWSTGMVACTVGLVVSYAYDLPTGPLVVCMFGLVLAIAALVRRFILPVPLTEPFEPEGGPEPR
jgi:zinc/manganese transport system permease protein